MAAAQAVQAQRRSWAVLRLLEGALSLSWLTGCVAAEAA